MVPLGDMFFLSLYRFPNFPGSKGTSSALVQLDQATLRKLPHNGHVGVCRIG